MFLAPVPMQVFKECHMNDESGNSFELSLVGCKCIGAYVRNKKNQNQVIGLFSAKLQNSLQNYYTYFTLSPSRRFAGFGKKLSHKMIGGSSGF